MNNKEMKNRTRKSRKITRRMTNERGGAARKRKITGRR